MTIIHPLLVIVFFVAFVVWAATYLWGGDVKVMKYSLVLWIALAVLKLN